MESIYSLTLLDLKNKDRSSVQSAADINQILSAIKRKSPDTILKKLDKDGQLEKHFDYYSKRSAEDPKQIAESIRNDDKKIIELLIDIHCLNIASGKQTSINWHAPAKIQHEKHARYISQDIAFFLAQNDRMPTHQPEKLISTWIDGRRVMPPGSPFEGIYKISKTPYIIEPCDNMSPFSPVRHTAMMKGVQVAATTTEENIIAYYIGERPTNILFMSATDSLLEIFVTERLEPLIDSCDLRHLISDQSDIKNTRRTGDKTQYKQFPGGSVILSSAQSAARMRSTSRKILLRDEIDGAPTQLTTGEGNWLEVSEGRLEAYGDRAKIFDSSTPTLTGESAIEIQYNKGDKRKYMVPCPMCEKFQYLSMGKDSDNWGLKGDYKGGKLIQGYYLCYHCHDAIFDHHKHEMLSRGHWEPTIAPKEKNYRSYHLPSFYSPPGMTSFTRIRSKYDAALESGDDGMRSFRNLYEGLPFTPTGEKPAFESVIEIRSKHKSGEVPYQILFLTMATDVQRGKEIYKEYSNDEIYQLAQKYTLEGDIKKLEELPRVETEVVGHGWEFRTASIIYKIFYGHIDDETSGALERLNEWMVETKLIFKRRDGFKFQVQRTLIDSGDGMFMDAAIGFCGGWAKTYPSKGRNPLKQDKMKMGTLDQPSRLDFVRYTESNGVILPVVNYYKNHIYRKLKNKPDSETGEQPANSHITPTDYKDKYFSGLTAETQRRDGTFHNQAGRRNEPLDLLVYNMCAADHFIDGCKLLEIERFKLNNPKMKLSKQELKEKFKRRVIMQILENELKKQGW